MEERKVSELREQFIAVLGHDLRNPVAAIDSGIQLLLGTPQTEKGQRIITMMQGSITRMRGLIDNVVDFARARLGDGLVLNIGAETPVQPVLEQVISELRSIEPDRSIEADILITKPVPLDNERIAQLLSNLLGNALTHGATNAPVRIHATTQNGMFELSVANKGVPIPPALLDKLFHPFFRGDQSKQQGLGLGLYIASEIARAHGGTLEATSDAEETRFTFRMPLN
jgi:signal transduction histidine kinase